MPVEDFFFGGCYFFTIYYGFTILSVLYKVRIGKRRLRLQPIIAFTINNGGFFSKLAKAQRCSYYEKPLLCVFGIINI